MMQLNISNIDMRMTKMVRQMRTMVSVTVDSTLILDISETCCQELAQTVKNLARTINSNL